MGTAERNLLLGVKSDPLGASSLKPNSQNKDGDPTVDKDRIKGKVKQIEGSLEEAKGRITHSNTDKVKGAMKKVEGKVQEGYGKAKDASR